MIVYFASPRQAQNYAIYLPSYYTSAKPFPCICFFDAHARGLLPIKLYKDLAEQYGFVFISSNISRNGMQWQETNEIVKAMMDDSRARINIDPKRIYAAGFSGGARVASSVALLDGGIAGVIGCAAGFPGVEHGVQNKFDYFGMAGDFDFNLSEMRQLDQTLQQNGFNHQLLTFEGKHDWPSVCGFLKTALLWLQVNAIKENLQTKNDTIITALKNDYIKHINAARSEPLKEYDLLNGMNITLNGLSNTDASKKQATDLSTSKIYKEALTLQSQLQQREATQQQQFQQQFTTKDITWWTKEISTLKSNSRAAKTKQEFQMNQRLLNFLGLVQLPKR